MQNICSTWQMAIQRRGNPLDQLLLPIQLGADEALILLVDRTVELARRRRRRILLRRLQRGRQPLPLSGKKRVSNGSTLQLLGVSHAGGGVIAGAHTWLGSCSGSAVWSSDRWLSTLASSQDPTSRVVCRIHFLRDAISACVSPNRAEFLSATSTAFAISSTCTVRMAA